jgi:hypothetical protein
MYLVITANIQTIKNIFKYTFIYTILGIYLLCSKDIYAQDILYTPHPNLDYIAVNNDVVGKDQEGFLKIYKQDTVKIAGIGSPNDTVKISFDEYEYTAHMDEYGNWFVVFSVQDLEKGSYPVSIQFNDGKQEHLNTLVIQGGDTMQVSDYSTPQEDTEEVVEEKEGFNTMYIPIAISIPVLLVIGAFSGMYISKRKK